jgi:diadenosine tetraphosphate (Ap4A) HIT family hydrolase
VPNDFTAAQWRDQSNADGCRFDQPRRGIEKDLLQVRQLSIATLYLERIQTYRGHCVLIFDARHVTRIDELTDDEWQLLAGDLRVAEQAVFDCFKPDHMNMASIGQMVPHLHWHIIPRYVDDPRWGGPIWTTQPDEMQQVYLTEAEYAESLALLNGSLSR